MCAHSGAMNRITFGIDHPQDLLEKLKHEGEKLTSDLHPYDVFNFFITASVMYEWTKKHYPDSSIVKEITIAIKSEQPALIPEIAKSWVVAVDCLPNKGVDPRRHIYNAIRICWETANASKHYHWHKSSPVTAVEEEPVVKDWYQYFFTSTEPGLYVEFLGEYYSVKQIKSILTEFYGGLLGCLSA